MIFDCNFWAVVRVEMGRDDNGNPFMDDSLATLEAVFDNESKAERRCELWSGRDNQKDTSYHVVSLNKAKGRWWGEIEDWACEAGKLAAMGVKA